MAIYRLIANGSFGPAEVKAMTAAYEAALLDLGLADRDDPITEIVATAIVSITSMGERDPAIVKACALNAIGARRYDPSATKTTLLSGIFHSNQLECRLLMLWTAPPPARECHECGRF
jgi:hypothetical protein